VTREELPVLNLSYSVRLQVLYQLYQLYHSYGCIKHVLYVLYGKKFRLYNTYYTNVTYDTTEPLCGSVLYRADSDQYPALANNLNEDV